MELRTPHDEFRDALSRAKWRIVKSDRMGTGPNPTRLLIRKGKIDRWIILYAWRITGEGSGRTKAGRTDLDYRVQTTRSHEGDLRVRPGHLSVGVGWYSELAVFGAFDVWIKRATGRSSSVHLSRRILEFAAALGWIEELRRDGPTFAFQPNYCEKYLEWLTSSLRPRFMQVSPIAVELVEDRLYLRLDPRGGRWQHNAVRSGDNLVIETSNRDIQRYVWKVAAVQTEHQLTGPNRPYMNVQCSRYAVIPDTDFLEMK